ncbi:ABC transporter permease [Paenibacillus harenae]|uniref:ABC-2 type transport system permease protein n=1 Tax=Paenibacillus harenae TaxID=306543 RepID=A0ABT9U6F3_PAEHA|nr:DUF2705 family protein [Paenibacillus harenae]MDQ0115219.1 ABC-2 type transport system permease protein [Paenibacillus harenae]
MGDFLQLVRNENIKVYFRPRTYIMAGLLVGAVILISVMWLLLSGRDTTMWMVAYWESFILFLLVTIFSVVIAAVSVAEEFTSGTIKLLLIRPWSRSKILLSKYISVVLFAALLTVLLLGSTLLVNWLSFGLFPSETALAIQEQLPGQENMSSLQYLFQFYVMKFIVLVVMITLAFMLSTIFRSSALAIGLALFLLLAMDIINSLFSLLNYKWIDYLLFTHLDLTRYIGHTTIDGGMTLGFSLGILGLYYVLFIALTWYIFDKRDVAG